jgi:integrase
MTQSSLFESLLLLAEQLSPCYRKAASAALRRCETLIQKRSEKGSMDVSLWQFILRSAIHRAELSRRVRNNYFSGIEQVLDLAVQNGLIAPATAMDRLGYPEIETDFGFPVGKRCYGYLVEWAVRKSISYADLSEEGLLPFWTYLKRRFKPDTVRHLRSGLKAFWAEGVKTGVLKELTVASGPVQSERKPIGLRYRQWPKEAKNVWSSVTQRCRNKTELTKEAWPISWAKDSLATYQRQLTIYLGYLKTTGKLQDPNWSFEEVLGDVTAIQACLDWLEELQPGRYHDRYYMPYICSMLLRHYYKNNESTDKVEQIKSKRHFPPPKVPGALSVSLENIQTRRSQLIEEIEDLSSGQKLSIQKVAEISDKVLMLFLMTRPVRLRNLMLAEFDNNLVKDSKGAWHLSMADYQVKNGEEIRFELPSDLGHCLDLYQQARVQGGLGDVKELFLNQRGEAASSMTIRSRVKKISIDLFGVDLSPHAFRGAVVSAYTTVHPEDLLAAQSLLGHTTINTSLRYYIQPDEATTQARVRVWLEGLPCLDGLKALAREVSCDDAERSR